MNTQTWIATLSRGINGIHVQSIRRKGRKRQAVLSAPQHVREYLLLVRDQGTLTEIPLDVFTDLKAGGDTLRVTRPDPLHVIVTFLIATPSQLRKLTVARGVPAIRNLRQLCEYFYADEPRSLNRRVYKGTICGASISLLCKDGLWLHNGTQGWDTVKAEDVVGFTLQTIVEGSDAEVNSHVFLFPVAVSEVEAWTSDMEAEADRLWHEANGEEADL